MKAGSLIFSARHHVHASGPYVEIRCRPKEASKSPKAIEAQGRRPRIAVEQPMTVREVMVIDPGIGSAR